MGYCWSMCKAELATVVWSDLDVSDISPPNITANATKCSAFGRVVGRMPARRALNIIEASSIRRDYVVEANSPLSRTVVTLVDPRGRSKRDRTEEYILDWNSILTRHCF